MRQPWNFSRLLIALSTGLVALSSFAGGPLVLGGPTAGVDGQPFVWNNSASIGYRVDAGPLGNVTNATAVSMVATAFSRWSSIATASISFRSLGTITGVTGGNVKTLADFETVYASCQAATQSPIIFDDDSSLLLALTGDSGVLGLTGPCALTSDGHIQSAFSILGNPSGLTSTQLQAVMVHEFGHFAGLDHSDVGEPLSTDTTQADIDNIPTMYWMLITDKQATPKADDRAWMSKLYPSSNYNSTYGMIRGDVLFSDGQYPVQDYLVVARKVDDIHGTAVSSISGYRFTGDPGQPYTADYLACTPPTACTNGYYDYNDGGSVFGSRDTSLIGTFEIPVPPGDYILELHGTAGGKIGPITPMLPAPGLQGYWPTDTYTSYRLITVSAGQTVDGIQAVLVGTPSAFDIFDHPASSPGATKPGQQNESATTPTGGAR